LARFVESARNHIPSINDLKRDEAQEIYRNLESLNNCLFFRNIEQEEVNVICSIELIFQGYEVIDRAEGRRRT